MSEKKPTILIVSNGYFPGKKYGGIVTSRYNFAETFGDDYDIVVVALNHDYRTEEPYADISDGWNTCGKARVLYLPDEEFCERSFAEIIAETKPILVYASGTITTYFYFNRDLFRAAKKANVPVLVTPDGDICTSAFRLKWWKKRLAAAYCKITNAFSDVYFQATSAEEAENLTKYLKINPRRVTLLPNAPYMFAKRECYEKKPGCLKVVYTSRVHPIKNLLYAIETVKQMQAPVTFDIYGAMEDTAYWEQCQQAIASAPSHVSIHYQGGLCADEAKQIAKQYDCFFLPTTGENYGYVIEEALLCGCPVIISRGTTPWDDLHGKAGFAGDLNNPPAFVKELDKIAAMDQSAYDAYTQTIAPYIREKLAYEQLCAQYKQLITTVASV